MSNKIRNAVIVSASPKVNETSVSELLASICETGIKSACESISRVNVRRSFSQRQTERDFAAMLRADAMIVIFPLYFFCLPGMLMRFLEDYAAYYAQHKAEAVCANVYAAVNCGFPEADINEQAVRVIESFSEKTGNRFRFGLLIGGGGMLQGAKDTPFMKKAMAVISGAFRGMLEDALGGGTEPVENIHVRANFPRRLYFLAGDMGWRAAAKKNGLTKRDLYKRPYREN